jgi:hypothetical protein
MPNTENNPTDADAADDDADTLAACDGCGDRFAAEDLAESRNGNPLCEGCRVECAECEEVVNADDASETRFVEGRSTTRYQCDDCSFSCDDCSRRWSTGIDERLNSNGHRICESCSNDYYTCDSCGDTMQSDDTNSTDGATLCNGCYADHESEDEDDDGLHGHSYRPRARFHTAPAETPAADTPFYGIEVECEAPGARSDLVADVHNAGDGFWYCKEDGSLQNGIEVVSHPATFAHWAQRDLRVFTMLGREGCRSYETTTCGMHVHVSRAALSSLAQTRLMRLFGSDARFILRASRRRAENLNRWAAIDDSPLAAIVRKVKGFGHGDRYRAVNLTNSATVEIRIFRGTLHAPSILRNIALVHSMVVFARTMSLEDMTVPRYLWWLASEQGRSMVGKTHCASLLAWLAPSYIKPRKPRPGAAAPVATAEPIER